MMKKKLALIITGLIIISQIPLGAQDKTYMNSVVERVYTVMTEEYDKYKDKSPMEKLILKMGRRTYMDTMYIWKTNYDRLDSLNIVLHPQIERILAIAIKHHHDPERPRYLRSIFTRLTELGYENLDMYYRVVLDYLEENDIAVSDIDIPLIDQAMCQIEYYDIKKKMYEEEEHLKNEVRVVMQEGKLKYKLALYFFAFNFFDKIRVRIIEQDMERMLAKINEKNAAE